MDCEILFSGKIRKISIVNLWSAEFALCMLSVENHTNCMKCDPMFYGEVRKQTNKQKQTFFLSSKMKTS